MLPKTVITFAKKTIEFYLYIQVPNVTSKNVSWLHFSWPTLYMEQFLDQISMATQVDIHKHKSMMQSSADDIR